MPIIRRLQTGSSADALNGQKFKVWNRAALVSLYIVGTTAGDTFGFAVGNNEIAVQGTRMNVKTAAGVIDSDRDQMLYREAVPPGEYFLPVTVTTDAEFLLGIEPL